MQNEIFEGNGFSIKVHQRTYKGVPYTGIPENLEVFGPEEVNSEVHRLVLSGFKTIWTVNGKRQTGITYRAPLANVGLVPIPEGVRITPQRFFPVFQGDGTVYTSGVPGKMTNDWTILDAFYGEEMAALILSKLPAGIWEKVDYATQSGQQI